ncbi:hypothetical protein DL98DRAFT_223051 [Cadophora sp. DSE1049]|nr:hypothetical protein DL98DRAFT_223051 [Cadophora sp. DSE1049]
MWCLSRHLLDLFLFTTNSITQLHIAASVLENSQLHTRRLSKSGRALGSTYLSKALTRSPAHELASILLFPHDLCRLSSYEETYQKHHHSQPKEKARYRGEGCKATSTPSCRFPDLLGSRRRRVSVVGGRDWVARSLYISEFDISPALFRSSLGHRSREGRHG